jgi:hypothetical protein
VQLGGCAFAGDCQGLKGFHMHQSHGPCDVLQAAARARVLADEAEGIMKLLEKTAGHKLTRNKVGGSSSSKCCRACLQNPTSVSTNKNRSICRENTVVGSTDALQHLHSSRARFGASHQL